MNEYRVNSTPLIHTMKCGPDGLIFTDHIERPSEMSVGPNHTRSILRLSAPHLVRFGLCRWFKSQRATGQCSRNKNARFRRFRENTAVLVYRDSQKYRYRKVAAIGH